MSEKLRKMQGLIDELNTIRTELDAVKNKLSETTAVLFKHWSSDYSGYERCDFCNVTQRRPSIERHKQNCPRLIWAIENDQTPAKRAAALGAFSDYVDTKILPPGDLSPEGQRLAALNDHVIQEATP